MKRLSLFVGAALAALGLGAITVSDVAVSQDQRGVVRVAYQLSAPAVVTVDFTTNGVSLLGGNGAPTGDLGAVWTAGAKTIVWKPRLALPKNLEIADVKATVKAYSFARLPDYMVVDPADGTRQFYDRAEDLPGGLIANESYRSTYIVMRRIPAAYREYKLGGPSVNWGGKTLSRCRRHVAMMTNDYYMSVFPMTRGQLARNRGWTQESQDIFTRDPFRTDPLWKLHPADSIGYDGIRGSTSQGVSWPETGTNVARYCWLSQSSSFETVLYRLRANTGILFDLPTDAQWEIAARGDASEAECCTMPYTQGDNAATTNAINRMGWCTMNWMNDPLKPSGATKNNFTHVVGQLEPNVFGLYDLCGNVRSYCRDWWKDDLGALTDNYLEPAGPTAAQAELVGGVVRCVSHGGQYNDGVAYLTLGNRNPESRAATSDNYMGFRLVCPAYAGGLILQ